MTGFFIQREMRDRLAILKDQCEFLDRRNTELLQRVRQLEDDLELLANRLNLSFRSLPARRALFSTITKE